jgi:hypothetical protein
MGDTSVRLLRSWRIPAFALLVLATHCVVEMFVASGFPRAVPILPSLFLSPLIVAAIAGRRRGLLGGAVNFAYLALSYTAFVLGSGWRWSGDFMTFLVVLFFGVVCGMCAGGLVDRLSLRFKKADYLERGALPPGTSPGT